MDLFRWVAAFLVLFAHITNRFMMPSSDMHLTTFMPFRFVFSFLSGFSHQAVIVFFVLSGFLVGGGLVREFERKGSVDIVLYAMKRIVRLWTVLIPTFALSFLLQYISVNAFDTSVTHILPSNIGQHTDLATLACNVVFLQTALCDQYAGNGPLWSLFNEFWYYVVWPLMFFALGTKVPAAVRLLCGCAATALLVGLTWLQFTGSSFAPYMLLWLIGVVVAVVKKPVVKSVPTSAALLVFFLLAVRLAIRRDSPLHSPLGTFVVDAVIATLFGHLLVAMKNAAQLFRPPLGGVNKELADFSFTLYCVHVPILNFYLAMVMNELGYGSQMKLATPIEWAIIVGPLLVVPVVAYGFSWITERRTDAFRAFLMQKLFGRFMPRAA
ncbi:acyltransferase family protein [Caulobacter segnis]